MHDAAEGVPPRGTFHYRRAERSLWTALVVAAVWLALVTAYVVIDASPVILAIVALFTLPALWDLATNPIASLSLTPQALVWQRGKDKVTIPLDTIDHIRLDTRLDLSVRATVVLRSGQRLRIPPDTMPPHRPFEHALHAAGVPTQRHHFSLRG